MELRKVTSRIVFIAMAIVMVGCLISSCNNEEYELPSNGKTMAKRTRGNSGESQQLYVCAGEHTFTFTGKQKLVTRSWHISWDEGKLYQDMNSAAIIKIDEPVWVIHNKKDEDSIKLNVVAINGYDASWGTYSSSEENIPITAFRFIIVSLTNKTTGEVLKDTIETFAGDATIRVPCEARWE